MQVARFLLESGVVETLVLEVMWWWWDHQVWAMATRNQARLLGLRDKGEIRKGADADLVLWRESAGRLKAARTFVAGKCVWSANVD